MTSPLLPLLAQLPPTVRRAVACACAERAIQGGPPDPSAATLVEALAVATGSPAACAAAWQAVLRHPWGDRHPDAARTWAWRAVWWACFPRPAYTADAARSALWMARRALAAGAGLTGSDGFIAVLTTEEHWQVAEARRYAAVTPIVAQLRQNGGTADGQF